MYLLSYKNLARNTVGKELRKSSVCEAHEKIAEGFGEISQ
jgi:hypothetical protein